MREPLSIIDGLQRAEQTAGEVTTENSCGDSPCTALTTAWLTCDAALTARAARFRYGLVEAIVGGCTRATGVHTVALPGGVFGNLLLLDEATRTLTDRGFEVPTHARTPPSDGGVNLGQAVVAGASNSLN